MGATDAFGNACDALGGPLMRRSDAGDAHTIDGSRISAVWPEKTFSFIVNSVIWHLRKRARSQFWVRV